MTIGEIIILTHTQERNDEMQPQIIHISEFTTNKDLAFMFIKNYCLSRIEEQFQGKSELINPNLDFLAVADIENDLIVASPEVYARAGLKSRLKSEEAQNKYPLGFGVVIEGLTLNDPEEIKENDEVKHIFCKIYSSFYTQMLKYIKAYKERGQIE
ncbi:MAG: hypothetical protein J5956_11385 [Ruminococcus sp.]|nr:hypothetical protein [Ruminococcus sp.]